MKDLLTHKRAFVSSNDQVTKPYNLKYKYWLTSAYYAFSSLAYPKLAAGEMFLQHLKYK